MAVKVLARGSKGEEASQNEFSFQPRHRLKHRSTQLQKTVFEDASKSLVENWLAFIKTCLPALCKDGVIMCQPICKVGPECHYKLGEAGLVAHVCNADALEGEAGGSPSV